MDTSAMSSTNYMNKSSCSRNSESSSEESGWTLYLEDFIANNDNNTEDGSLCTSGYQSSSMVSDAACSAVRNLDEFDNSRKHVRSAGLSLHRHHDKLVSKRRKTKVTLVDQELEDTASSPGNSPKVNDLHHLYMSSKGLDIKNNSQAYSSSHFLNAQREDRSSSCSQEKAHISQETREVVDMGFLETELNRKGLCLVPISTLLCHLS